MDQHKYVACDVISRNADCLYVLSRQIWAFAEVGLKEEKSSRAIIRFLKKNEFKITKNFKGLQTAFKAEYGDTVHDHTKLPNIAVICQYDAVHGNGHIHGNNLVAELAVATALGIQEAIRATSGRLGKVTLIGCPDSLGGGLVTLMRRKAFKDFDLALGAVPGPRTEWCPVYKGTRTFKARFTHIEPRPCLKISDTEKVPPMCAPLNAAVMAQSNVFSVQQHFGKGWEAHGVISRGGRKASEPVIEAETLVEISAKSDADLKLMEKRIVPCLEAAAEAATCEFELTTGGKMYHSLASSPHLGYLLQLNAYHCGMLATPLKKKEVLDPVDMANVSHLVPTLRPMFYTGCDAKPGTAKFKVVARSQQAHAYAIAMAKALAMTAVDMLNSPLALDDARTELKLEIMQQKNVPFLPFPQKKEQTLLVPKNVPADCNIGWSKQP